ncbi:MAG: SHOCT domain-containing protein, partial [Stenotrophomonas sp.]
KRPPEQPSAAARVAREAQLSPELQAQLAALNQRKDHGDISEAEYERQRAALLAPR